MLLHSGNNIMRILIRGSRCFIIPYRSTNSARSLSSLSTKALFMRWTQAWNSTWLKAINYFANRFCWWLNTEAMTKHSSCCNRFSPQQTTSLQMFSLLLEEILNRFFPSQIRSKLTKPSKSSANRSVWTLCCKAWKRFNFSWLSRE